MIRFDVDVCTFLLCCALHFVFREYYGLTWLDLTWLDLFRIRYFHCNNISLSIERQEVLLGWINCHVGTIFELFANKYGMHSFKCMFSFAIHFHIRFTFTSIYIYVYLWLCLFHLLTFNDMIPFTFTHSLTMIHFVFCVLCFILCFILFLCVTQKHGRHASFRLHRPSRQTFRRRKFQRKLAQWCRSLSYRCRHFLCHGIVWRRGF